MFVNIPYNVQSKTASNAGNLERPIQKQSVKATSTIHSIQSALLLYICNTFIIPIIFCLVKALKRNKTYIRHMLLNTIAIYFIHIFLYLLCFNVIFYVICHFTENIFMSCQKVIKLPSSSNYEFLHKLYYNLSLHHNFWIPVFIILRNNSL